MSFMEAVEKAKVEAMAKALAESRRRSLAVRMPAVENVADSTAYKAIDISLKVWDVLNGLLEIAGCAEAQRQRRFRGGAGSRRLLPHAGEQHERGRHTREREPAPRPEVVPFLAGLTEGGCMHRRMFYPRCVGRSPEKMCAEGECGMRLRAL